MGGNTSAETSGCAKNVGLGALTFVISFVGGRLIDEDEYEVAVTGRQNDSPQ